MRARLAPIRTRACVATAGPAKPVTHAARRHQHHTVTPTPTPNGGRGRGRRPLCPLFVSSGREHRGSSVLRSSPSSLRLTQGLRAIQRRGYTHTHSSIDRPIAPRCSKPRFGSFLARCAVSLRGRFGGRCTFRQFWTAILIPIPAYFPRKEIWIDRKISINIIR